MLGVAAKIVMGIWGVGWALSEGNDMLGNDETRPGDDPVNFTTIAALGVAGLAVYALTKRGR